MLKEEVTEEDIAEVVARWTGIPVVKLVASEKDKLLHLEDELHRRVVGQEDAVRVRKLQCHAHCKHRMTRLEVACQG